VNAPHDARVKEAFLRALELGGGEREAFLDGLAREDAALAEAVRGLLAAHAAAEAAELAEAPQALGASLERLSRPAGWLGDYELLEEVGAGASGVVWRARQASLGRVVALKVLRGGPLAGARELARLRAEAEAIARLDHAHIVPVHEIGEHEGHPFFSMKWLEGGTLAERLARPWSAHAAARLMVDVARAVHHAHQRGLLHRDLKPSNVLLDAAGRAHVADFGIAKRLEGEGTTRTQTLAGTPAYMAPEQAEGGELTVATDVWALGCLLYELLTARAAFGGDSVTEVLRRVRHEAPAAPRALVPEVPRDLETIVLVALRKDPARRYASADAFAEDLERWLAHEPIAARRTGAWERAVLFAQRSPLAASLIGLAAGLLLLLAAVSIWASLALGGRLREALLGEARATRLSGALGARSAALERLARAAAIRTGQDLRDEAVACLALTDLALERTVPRPAGLDMQAVPVADPGGARLAVGDAHGLRLLDARDGHELAVLNPAPDVSWITWSPGGRWLLSKHHLSGTPAGTDSFRIWDVAAQAEVAWVPAALSFRAAAFAPDEERLAYGDHEGRLFLQALEWGGELWRARLEGRANTLAFDGAGALLALATAGETPQLELRESETGALRQRVALEAEPYDLCWTADGRELAVACADGRIYLFGREASAPCAVLQGHAAEVVELFASPRAPLLSSHAWDETTRLWDLASGRELRRVSARALGFTADGEHFLLTDASSWSTWRVQHGDFLRVLTAHAGKSPRALAFAPDGRLATAGPDGVHLWARGAERSEPLHAHDTAGVAFVDGGRALVTAGADGLWRTELEPRGAPVQLQPEPLWSLAVSADGRTLAAQGAHSVLLLDPLEGERLGYLAGPRSMEYVALDATGQRIAVGNWRGEGVLLWSPREGLAPRRFLPEQVNVAVALAPDGATLATATSERVELWDVASGARLHGVERQRAFGNAPGALAFSPDGTRLAFGLSNEIVRIVDARTFATLLTLEPPQLEAHFRIAFSADGALLGVACGTNHVQLWDLAGLERELERLGLGAGH